MLPLRMLGFLMLMFLLCDAESTCTPDINPLTLDPPEIIGSYGVTVIVNCSSDEQYHDGMYWRPHGNKTTDEEMSVLLYLPLTDWYVKPECRIIFNESFECGKDLEITIYKTPDIVSVSAMHKDSMVEGTDFQLNCDIINVAPVQKLKVKWYRGNETVHTETFNETSVTPVNVTSIFVFTPERDYNGTLFRCEAELHLGPNGPELIPTESSSPYTAVVLYKPLIRACPDRYTGLEDHFSMNMLDCDADGNPPPTLQWYYQGNPIDAAEPLNRTHSGKYTAEFVNSVGTSETSLNITVEYGPSFTCNHHHEVQEGDDPQTVCEPKGMPKPNITWFKDGKRIEALQRWTRHDSGQYLLRAINKHGTANHSLHLDVLYAPEFKSNGHFDVSVVEGDNFTLTCEADGSPPPVFNWTHDGVNILENSNDLKLTRVMSNATYTCTAANKLGSMTKKIHVRVIKNTTRAIQAPMTTPNVSEPTDCPLILTPSEVVVRFGDQASVNCNTSATDALGMGWEAAVGGKGFEQVTAITWTVEKLEEWTIKPQCYITIYDQQCSVTPSITLYKTPDIVSVSAMHKDSMVEGTLFQLNCDIINVAPVQKLKVKWYRGNETVHTETFNETSVTPVNVTSIFVFAPERDYNGTLFRCEAELHLGPNGPELIPTESSSPYTAVVLYNPLIRACPDRYTGVEDHFSMNMLDCDADGNPPPTLQWYYQGNPIDAAEPLNRTHSGKYTAEFVNSFGTTETSVDITVEYGPSFTCNDHHEVQEGDDPQTVCEPKGMPKPNITWFKDGKRIEALQRWTRHDSGQYLLRAINKHGTANHSLHLDVLYKPLIRACPDRYTGVEDHFSMNMLSCEADGNPPPTLQWYYQGNPLDAAEPLNRTHSGKYTAEFVNSFGTSETSVDITVEYTPLFTCKGHYEVQEGDDPQTVCEPKGMPKPTVTWFKDGKRIETPQRWTKHDNGQYLLRATNKHGTANHSLHLDVLYAPVFKQRNNTVTITSGENVTFDCHAVGNPPPAILWNYTPAENVMETTWGRQRNITVKGATSTNAAVYICVATNKVGSVTRYVKLIMEGESASAQTSRNIWWIIIPLILLVIVLAVIYHKCHNKYGKYNFVPIPGSDIPLTTKY